MKNSFGEQVVEEAIGGLESVGARVADFGREVLALY